MTKFDSVGILFMILGQAALLASFFFFNLLFTVFTKLHQPSISPKKPLSNHVCEKYSWLVEKTAVTDLKECMIWANCTADHLLNLADVS